MFPNNKQNKLKQMKKDKTLKEESYLTVMENARCLLISF